MVGKVTLDQDRNYQYTQVNGVVLWKVYSSIKPTPCGVCARVGARMVGRHPAYCPFLVSVFSCGHVEVI